MSMVCVSPATLDEHDGDTLHGDVSHDSVREPGAQRGPTSGDMNAAS